MLTSVANETQSQDKVDLGSAAESTGSAKRLSASRKHNLTTQLQLAGGATVTDKRCF
jgi:hypothetical protein